MQLLLGERSGNRLLETPGSLQSLDVQTPGAERAMQLPALTGFGEQTAKAAPDSNCRSGNRSLAPRLWQSFSISIQRRRCALHAWGTFRLIHCTLLESAWPGVSCCRKCVLQCFPDRIPALANTNGQVKLNNLTRKQLQHT